MISDSFWFWQFLGRLHPMIVHFPISLLLFAAILEVWTIGRPDSKLKPGIHIMVKAGIFSAWLSLLLGLLLAGNEDISGELLDWHRLTGILTGVGSLLILIFFHLSIKKQRFLKWFRASLFLTSLSVIITGHLGASLTHGENYLTETFPWSESNNYQTHSFELTKYGDTSGGLSHEKEIQLIGEVRTILAHNCYKCHSGAKVEADLRLDSKESVYKGGESGEILLPGNATQSEMIRRISLSKNHKDVMPSKGKLLSKDEITLLGFWIDQGAPWPDDAENPSIYRVAKMEPRKPNLPKSTVGFENPVDLWVDLYFKENGITWQQTVDDKTYLRRIYLDVVGLVPSPSELESFNLDDRPDKRDIWLRDLLDRKEDYAQHWLTFWNDILRNDYTGTGYITKGRYNITDWLYKSLQENKPYHQLVRELLNPTEESKGFIEGIRWRGTVNASQRTEMQAAQNVGQVILGLNLKCASCHDSFISDWKLEEAYAFANIFADSTLELSRCDIPTGKMAGTKILWEELGEIDSTATRSEKLRQLSDYLVQPANGRMYRTMVNRVWKQMMGRGIVEPVDEMDNEPWSQDLLDWLASEFVDKNYDLKGLIYLIASSRIYQSGSIGVKSPDLLFSEDYKFTGMVRRRLTAEQFSDAISRIFYPVFEEKDLKYKPDQLLPEQKPTEFPRASLVANNSFLTAMGRPNREIVSTSRDSQANLLQSLELTNGEKLNNVLQKGADYWKEKYPSSDAIIQEVFAQTLNRKPSQKEFQIAKAALGDQPETDKIQDLFWAVLLLPEFQLIY
ncbi:DUF1549 domain-containing protein [Aquiflexum sp.]|uniref:DUF1549 domain-containing protein n=1 Tax=Aquiflexum sp. TaxID=1872584 RepID=UPI003593B2FE